MSTTSLASVSATEEMSHRDLEELRKEKIRFNRTKLKLSPKKAAEWADRTVRIVAGDSVQASKTT